MNLLLVKSIGDKNIFRVIGDASYTNKDNSVNKIILYKNYKTQGNDNILSMDANAFWENYELLSLDEQKSIFVN
jgi:hypothetical protein